MFAFIHIPKTAGSSMVKILRASFGTRHCDVINTHKDRNFISTRRVLSDSSYWPFTAKSIASHNISLLESSDSESLELKYFSFLREPVARTISHYQFHINRTKSNESLEKWLKKERMQNFQSSYFSKAKCASEAIDNINKNIFFIGITEEFNKSVALLSSLSERELFYSGEVRKNISTKNQIKKNIYENQELLHMVSYYNKEDADLYSYFLKQLTETEAPEKLKRSLHQRIIHKYNENANRLIRNIYYKPRVRRAKTS